MPPAGQAVRLVEHPSADLPLGEGLAHGDAAKLLRGDDENAGVAQAYPIQRLLAFRHGQQAVDGDGATDAVPFQAGHLIRHERHQRGDHHRQRPGFVVAGQGGNLVAQGLAGSRG